MDHSLDSLSVPNLPGADQQRQTAELTSTNAPMVGGGVTCEGCNTRISEKGCCEQCKKALKYLGDDIITRINKLSESDERNFRSRIIDELQRLENKAAEPNRSKESATEQVKKLLALLTWPERKRVLVELIEEFKEADRRVREEAERRAREGAERKAREEAERKAKEAAIENVKRRGSDLCRVCGSEVMGAMCRKCRTIRWTHVFRAEQRQRELSTAPDPMVSSNAPAVEGRKRVDSANPTQRQYNAFKEYQMRVNQLRHEISGTVTQFKCDRCQKDTSVKGLCDECVDRPLCLKCNTHFPAALGCCPQCEVMCVNKHVNDKTATYCPKCNADLVLKAKLCSTCGRARAAGPSGLCKECAQRPVSMPAYSQEELKAAPSTQAHYPTQVSLLVNRGQKGPSAPRPQSGTRPQTQPQPKPDPSLNRVGSPNK